MRHAISIAQYTILACFMLFIILLTLSARTAFVGKATSATTVMIIPAPPMNCSFSPKAGYNIISFPCIIGVARTDNITNETNVTAMYQYVPGDQDLWRVYNPHLPDYVVNDLVFLTRRVGYITIMNASADKLIEGGKLDTAIPLVPGWNLVGYPTNMTRNASAGLALINDTYSVVITYNKSSEAFVSYPGGGLTDLIPSEGYWINITNTTTWVVD